MATETVTPTVTLPEGRVDAAYAAGYEIQLLTEMLLPFIQNEDGEGRIATVASSTLKRIWTLTDYIAAVLDAQSTKTLDELKAQIDCKLGVSHG